MATHEIRNTAARDGGCDRQGSKDLAQEKEIISPPHAAGSPAGDPVGLRSSLLFRDGYSDPTAFFALRNVMKDSKKQQKQPKDTDKLKAADKPGPVDKPKAARKRRPQTQVIHYD